MTIEQAITVLRVMETYMCSGNPIWRTDLIREAVSMACEALERTDIPQTNCERCAEYGSYKCTKCDGEMYYKPQTETEWLQREGEF